MSEKIGKKKMKKEESLKNVRKFILITLRKRMLMVGVSFHTYSHHKGYWKIIKRKWKMGEK